MLQRQSEPRLQREILLALTRAVHGSRRLDQLLAYACGRAAIDADEAARLLFDGGPATGSLDPSAPPACPAYTSDVDALLPGEAILAVEPVAARRRWRAAQQVPGAAACEAEAGTEVLARRAAALSWLLSSETASDDTTTDRTPAATADESGRAEPGAGSVSGGLEIPARLGLEAATQASPASAAKSSRPETAATSEPPEEEADDDGWRIMF